MTIAGNFLVRFAIPLITASLLFNDDLGGQQVEIYDRVQRRADEVLSVALKQGDPYKTEVFDYIVVGGGSAGAVVANRLSASGNFSVLLVEAGGDPNPISDIPIARRHIWEHSSLVKNYKSVPQSNSCLGNGGCDHPRAITLGGCSVINEVLYNRCNRNDYDSWAKFTKNPIWTWNSIVEKYKQIEDYHGFHETNPGSHGLNGEVYIGKIDHIPGADFLLEAFAAEGIPVGGDLTSGSFPYGYSKIDYSIKKGLRQSSFHAFILPILEDRANLKIYRYAWATRIVLDNQTKRAVGVEYKRHGKMGYAEARKEVIVCAGAYESPKLLMLSGIGPKAHLEEMGIDTVVDSPAVGNYLQDEA